MVEVLCERKNEMCMTKHWAIRIARDNTVWITVLQKHEGKSKQILHEIQ